MLDPDQIRERIKVARSLRGMSQTELAALLHEEDGWGLHDLGKLERGDDAFPPTAGRRRAIAFHLQVPEEFLTQETPFPAETAQLAQLSAQLETARAEAQAERQDLRDQIEEQNKNLADQTGLLVELKALAGEIRSLVAVLQDVEVIERSAVAAVRALPEWPAGPSTSDLPAQGPGRDTGTSDHGDRRVRDRRRAAS